MSTLQRMLTSSLAFTTMTKPTLRGIIFDMDGTLTKPNLDWGEMYRRCGVPLGQDILEAVKHMEESKASAAHAIIEEMEEEGRRTLQLTPGALEFGRWLNSHGVPMAIVTRNTAQTVDTFVNNCWMTGSSDAVPTVSGFSPMISRDSHDELPFKPHPASAEYIAKGWSLELPTKDIVMVGDSPSNDIVFGKNAGISTALVDTGRRHGEVGEEEKADFLVEHLWQLPRELWQSFAIEGPLGSDMVLHKYSAPEPKSLAAIAAFKGDLNTLSSLSEHELTTADDGSGNTALIWAADAGQADAVEMLLETYLQSNKGQVDARGFLGATAVSRASRRGHVDTLRLLLERGRANPDIANDKMQYPLHFAAFKKHPDAVSTLMKYGANTLVLDRKGRTPAEDTSDEAIRDAIVKVRDEQLKRT